MRLFLFVVFLCSIVCCLIPEEWLCGHVHSIQQKTGPVHSRSECWMRLVSMALPSSTNASHPQTMPSKSLRLSSDSDGHSLVMPPLMDSRSMNDSSQELVHILINTRLFLTYEGRVHGLTLTSVDDHPMTLTSASSVNQTLPLSFSFNPHSARPGMRS